MRVVIIEDQLMMREILALACRRDFGCEVAAECGTGRLGLEAIAQASPAVVLLDLQLPDCDGLDLLDTVHQRYPAVKILVLSSRCDAFAVYRVERARASGYVDKGSQTVQLLGTALAAIAAGGVYFSSAFHEAKLARRNNPVSWDKLLSDREQAVLLQLADCFEDTAVATRLGISPGTAEKHRFNLMRKLGLKSAAELQAYARAQGFAAGHPPR
jgi:DNA-binding NarL/FixJ family response regulator